MMDQPSLTYSLSFRHAKGKDSAPELVITLRDEDLAHTVHLLNSTRLVELSDLSGYLREDYADPWHEPEFDLSSRNVFGIRACGYITSVDGISEIHFPYVRESVYRVTKTLNVLFAALTWAMEREGVASNRHQLCTVSTWCEHRSMGWGHAMNGDIYPVFRRWLAALQPDRREVVEEKMSHAVTEGYVAFAEPHKRKETRKLWKDMCYGKINDEGRFIINCPGNACDIAIYPENDFQHEDYIRCAFSCHNLDGAEQQLSLLAGFATLCELAREDIEKD